MIEEVELDVHHIALALVVDGSRVLVGERPPGSHLAGRSEFPGGKREEGEEIVDCLARELAEEVGARLVEARPIPPPIHRVYDEVEVVLFGFLCRIEPCELTAPWRWVAFDDLADLEFPAANRPFLRLLSSGSEPRSEPTS